MEDRMKFIADLRARAARLLAMFRPAPKKGPALVITTRGVFITGTRNHDGELP
jgi:hypothetical protein